jgi:hypothetical protein
MKTGLMGAGRVWGLWREGHGTTGRLDSCPSRWSISPINCDAWIGSTREPSQPSTQNVATWIGPVDQRAAASVQ